MSKRSKWKSIGLFFNKIICWVFSNYSFSYLFILLKALRFTVLFESGKSLLSDRYLASIQRKKGLIVWSPFYIVIYRKHYNSRGNWMKNKSDNFVIFHSHQLIAVCIWFRTNHLNKLRYKLLNVVVMIEKCSQNSKFFDDIIWSENDSLLFKK